MKKLILLTIFSCFSYLTFSQELNCQISIIPSSSLSLGPVEKETFKELESAIYDFMNNTKWTNDIFEIEERINCNIQITITDLPTTTSFKGKIQIRSTRPVYNTSYNTTLFNHEDADLIFTYLRNSAILPMSNYQYRDNLSAILSFYAYIILGFDYDSFKLNGGDPHFKAAQQIANNAKSSGDDGWSSGSGNRRNRFWMIDNVLQPIFSPLRTTYYDYHRLGFDLMYSDLAAGRKAVLASLQSLDKIQKSRPGSLNIYIFLTSKSTELINLFSDAETAEKNAAVSILKRLDPSNSSKYQEILG
ncbi:type IX secretion system protein PorD [Crocinitomix catalasitica]|uniref:type IX secretion system protein PorD n=1 Tax=Crocinitomix catalasitica TaxID=184607 RepID=UPI000486E4B8|nr:DUF4835 family protein [Crocinitomix catalasitica]